jgi:hypothetical protein
MLFEYVLPYFVGFTSTSHVFKTAMLVLLITSSEYIKTENNPLV